MIKKSRPQEKIKVSAPHITEKEMEAVARVLESGNLASGEEVKEFEREFAAHVNKRHAIAVSSGTAALDTVFAICWWRVSSGAPNAIIPALSFFSTASMAYMNKYNPIFVDVGEDGCIHANLVNENMSEDVEFVVPVHLYGKMCEDIDEIYKICEEMNTLCFIDSCQAHAHWSANNSHIACYSFYPTKPIAIGEGGMIVTNSDIIAEKVRLYINHGQNKKYNHIALGTNYRMSDIHAAIGRAQLSRYKELHARRHVIAKYYNYNLSRDVVVPIYDYMPATHDYTTYTVLVKSGYSREKIIEHLSFYNIETAVHYPKPIYKQPLFNRGYLGTMCPMAELLSSRVLSLPCHPGLTDEQVEYVVDTINLIPKERVRDENGEQRTGTSRKQFTYT